MRRGLEFMKTFPQPDVLVVVDAPPALPGALSPAANRRSRTDCAASSRSSRCSITARSNLAAPLRMRSQKPRDLKLDTDYQTRVRQTGLVPIDDDEFASLKEDA